MKFKKFGSKYLVRIDKGEEVVKMLTKLCTEQKIKLGSITGIGAASKVKLGLFDVKKKEYHAQELSGDFEIAPLVGNITTVDGKPYLHLHINIGDKNQKSFSGHLNSAVISATFEAVLDVIDGSVDRKFDDETGLNLIKF